MKTNQGNRRQARLLPIKMHSLRVIQALVLLTAGFISVNSAFSQGIDCNFDQEIISLFSNPMAPKDRLIATGGKLFALLVGINDANFQKFDTLRRPEPDIDTLSIILKNQHYNIVALKGKRATRQNVLKWLKCFRQKLKINDRLLFYFAGHATGLSEMALYLRDRTRKVYFSKINAIRKSRGSPRFKDSLCLILCQPAPGGISNFVEVEEVAALLDSSKAYQKVMIIDACYGGEIDRIFHLPLDVFSHRLRSDGFFALTSAKRPVEDSLTAPIFFEALRGAADDTLAGNRDGAVSLYEASIYMDYKLHKVRSQATGEPYKSRYIFVGSGEVIITAYPKKSAQNE